MMFVTLKSYRITKGNMFEFAWVSMFEIDREIEENRSEIAEILHSRPNVQNLEGRIELKGFSPEGLDTSRPTRHDN